jgi:hypothetical protein
METSVCTRDATHTGRRDGAAALGHSWGTWIQTTAPACTEAGVETRTCNNDATHKETRAIDALGHDWGDWIITKKPTNTEKGEKIRICANDPSHREELPVDPLDPFIAEGSPFLGEPVIIYRSSANGPTSRTFMLVNPEQYTSITWYVYNITGSGETFTLDSSNSAYNMIGTHVLTLEVVKNGLLYSTVITFEVRNED